MIDYQSGAVLVMTGIDQQEVFANILEWAGRSMEIIANEEQDRFPDGIVNFFDCYVGDPGHQEALVAAGYQEFPSWTQAHRWQSLDHDLTLLELLEGQGRTAGIGYGGGVLCRTI